MHNIEHDNSLSLRYNELGGPGVSIPQGAQRSICVHNSGSDTSSEVNYAKYRSTSQSASS